MGALQRCRCLSPFAQPIVGQTDELVNGRHAAQLTCKLVADATRLGVTLPFE